MIRAFTYPLCYMMGMTLFRDSRESQTELYEAERNTAKAIFFLTAGATGHFALNMIVNFGADSRDGIDFWTKGTMSATGQATLAGMLIALIAAFLFSNVGKRKKLIAIAALGVVVAYNLILAGRTLFVLLFILCVFAYIYRNKVQHRKFLKTVLVIALIVALLIVLYSVNLFGIKDAVEGSNFYDRFYGGDSTQNIDDDKRMTHKMAYVTRMLDHPFGGGHIRAEYGHSAHDLYLDTYDESGVLALLFIAVYITLSLSRLVKCMKSKHISFETKQLVACTYIVINIQFWLEPIIRGMPWLLASYCFIDGVLTYLLNEEAQIASNEPLSEEGVKNAYC